MKFRYTVFSIMLFLIIITINAGIYAFFPDLEWEQQGTIDLLSGYNWSEGDTELDLSNQSPGFFYDYSIDLSGSLYNDLVKCSYAFIKEPQAELDWEMYLESPWFTSEYSKGIALNFPQMNLAFKKNKIDGFKLQTANENLTVFRGKENYIPMSKKFTVYNPNQNEFSLLEIPSAGDLLEFSEVIIVNGEVLTRMRDYMINYLNGKLQLLIPLEIGTIIYAKFQFIITNEELAPKGEILQGVILTKRWRENHLTAYYLQRGHNLNLVGGISSEIIRGPFSIKGECAISNFDHSKSALAYDMECRFVDERLDINYQISDIDSDFQEISVNSYNEGFSDQLALNYKLDEIVDFQLKTTSYKVIDEKEILSNKSTTSIVNQQISKNQSYQLIFDMIQREQDEVIKKERDFSLGYMYKSKPLSISAGQSLINTENRFVKAKVNINRFRLSGEYDVKNLWTGKEHNLKLEIKSRPVDIMDFTNFLEYQKPFEAKRGNLRFQLLGNLYPVENLYLNGGYIYFNNPKYDSYTDRYNWQANYNLDYLNCNFNGMKTNIESISAKTDKFEIGCTANINLLDDYQIEYKVNQDNF